MELPELLKQWLSGVAKLSLSREVVQKAALSNMLVFRAEELRLGSISAEEVARFAMEAYKLVCMKAAKKGFKGCFYFWFDEQSGTLRMSVAPVASASELPFTCGLEVVEAPIDIARHAVQAPYAAGIPRSELREVPYEDVVTEPPAAFTLKIFVKRLVAVA